MAGIKKLLALFIFALIGISGTTMLGYSHFDDLDQDRPLAVSLGFWDFPGVPFANFDDRLASGFFTLFGVDTLTDLYANTTFSQIMNAASKTTNGGSTYSGTGYTISGVEFANQAWQIRGDAVYTSGNTSLGFVRQLDRSLNTSSQPIHQVMPSDIASPLPYPEYSFFTAYDIKNSVTGNAYGLRLDNQVVMTTMNPVANLDSISFYALRGLKINSAERLVNRQFVVQISATGIEGSFVNVGTAQTLQAPPTAIEVFNASAPASHAFPFYEFVLTTTQKNNMPASGYYVRISFSGGVQGNGGSSTRSRMVIDDFQINND